MVFTFMKESISIRAVGGAGNVSRVRLILQNGAP